MTPNYNDGKFHSWNGGECPVHPHTVVEAIRGEGKDADVVVWRADAFQECNWTETGKSSSIRVFRVITPYVEPAPDPVKPAKRDLRTIDEHELFGKLDERTQKRLRKAAKRGWPVQMFYISAWCELGNPSFLPDGAYRLDPAFTPPAKRVKPKPVCATITQDMWLVDYYPMNGVPVTITFTRTNGMVDNDSYKVEVKG